MFRNFSCLGPEFVRTSQLVKENLVVTLSVGHPTLIKINGFHFMEIAPIALLLKDLGGVRSGVNGHECSAHEENTLTAKFTHEFHIHTWE